MYSVCNSKSCDGMDGIAYSCTLLRDGKKIANVINDGNGGPTYFGWVIPGEEKPFEDYVKTLTYTFEGETMPHNGETLVGEMLDELEKVKKIKRWSKKTMVFRLKGDEEGTYKTLKSIYNEAMRDWIIGKYGDKVEVIYDKDGKAVELPVKKEVIEKLHEDVATSIINGMEG